MKQPVGNFQKIPPKVTTDAQLVEADIYFLVMTQEQYEGKLTKIKREQLHDREEQLQMFLGKKMFLKMMTMTTTMEVKAMMKTTTFWKC